MYIASAFKVLQSCDAGSIAGKFYITDHSSSAVCSCHKAFAVVRTNSQRLKQHLKIRVAQTGLHNCISFKNRSLTNSRKLIHIVTLCHNNTPLFFEKGLNGVDVKFGSRNSSSIVLHKTAKHSTKPWYYSQIKFACSIFYISQEKPCEFIVLNSSGNFSPKLYTYS